MTYRLRILSSVLFCVVILMIAGTVTAAAESILGDADADGTVTILDATTIQKQLASMAVNSYNEAASDVDRDGKVTILDATYIQKWLASIDTPYPIGTPFDTPTEQPTETPTEQMTGQPTEAPTQSPTDEEGWGYDIIRP